LSGYKIVEVQLLAIGNVVQLFELFGRQFHLQRIEILLIYLVEAQFFEGFAQQGSPAVDAAGDGAQAFGTVVNGIHAGHDGEQYLGGTDIRSGFFAADVLFAGLQGHAVGGIALGINRNANQTARNLALELVFSGEKSGMRPAVTHGHAKTLCRTNHHIGAPAAGRLEQHQRHEVGHYGHVNTGGFGLAAEIGVIAYTTVTIGVLEQHAKEVVVAEIVIFDETIYHLNAQRLGAGFEYGFGLREALFRHKKLIAFVGALHAVEHEHGFGGGGGFIQKRGIGYFHAGEVAHHGLEIEQGFEAALGNFGLVGRVLGVPTRIFEDVAQDDARHNHVVIAQTDVVFVHLVFIGHHAQGLEHFVLVEGRLHVHEAFAANVGGHGLVDELFERINANGAQHMGEIGGVGANVAGLKLGAACNFCHVKNQV